MSYGIWDALSRSCEKQSTDFLYVLGRLNDLHKEIAELRQRVGVLELKPLADKIDVFVKRKEKESSSRT